MNNTKHIQQLLELMSQTACNSRRKIIQNKINAVFDLQINYLKHKEKFKNEKDFHKWLNKTL